MPRRRTPLQLPVLTEVAFEGIILEMAGSYCAIGLCCDNNIITSTLPLWRMTCVHLRCDYKSCNGHIDVKGSLQPSFIRNYSPCFLFWLLLLLLHCCLFLVTSSHAVVSLLFHCSHYAGCMARVCLAP